MSPQTATLLLIGARAADMLSSWRASPDLRLELNPIYRHGGWSWVFFINLAAVSLLSLSAPIALIVAATSMLLAVSNSAVALFCRRKGASMMLCGMCILTGLLFRCALDSDPGMLDMLCLSFLPYGLIMAFYSRLYPRRG